MNLSILLLAAAGAIGLSFEKPLASGHLNFCGNIRHFDVALDRPMDLGAAKGVSFELKYEDPSVIENVWLLFNRVTDTTVPPPPSLRKPASGPLRRCSRLT